MPQEKGRDHGRFEYLDALRGFAILGVLSTHCALTFGHEFRFSQYAISGAYGVQLFFMISAFTIFLTLDGAIAGGKQNIVRSFYIRRFFRILPMFWVGIILYCFAPCREKYSQVFQITGWFYGLTAVLLHGWNPFTMNSVVPGGWTIAIEGTFYIFAPLLFRFLRRWQFALFFLLTCFPVAYFANHGVMWLHHHRGLFAGAGASLMELFTNRWFFTQLPVFVCGILTYWISQTLPESFLTKTTGVLLLISGAAGLNWLLGGVIVAPLFQLQLLLSLCFMLLMLGLRIFPLPLLVNRFSCTLGQISYSFYLLHFVFLSLANLLLHRVTPSIFSHGAATFLALMALTIIMTVPASLLTQWLVERPFISLGKILIQMLADRKSQGSLAVEAAPASSAVS